MGLRVGRKSHGAGEKSGDETSPRLESDTPPSPRKRRPHMPHQLEKSHLLRRPGSPKRGDALAEGQGDTTSATETTTSAGQPSKSGLSLKNPFSRKKHQQPTRGQENENQTEGAAHEQKSTKLGPDGVFGLIPGAATGEEIMRVPTEVAGAAPLSYKSFGHKLDCGGDLQRVEQGHMARFGDFATLASLNKPFSTDLDNANFSVHRYDTSRGKILQQVSLAGVCAEAAQAERQQAILETLAGKTWREKLQWGLDRKNLGNAYYQQKKFSEAISAYEDCLLALDFGTTPEEQQAVQQQLQLPVVLNLAACMLAIKCYQKCKALCDVALTLDPNCLKAVFRKGLACFHMGELGQARENLLQAYRFCCGHLPAPTEILPDSADCTAKPDSSDLPTFLSLTTTASKEFNGRPVGEEKEKFVKKVKNWLTFLQLRQMDTYYSSIFGNSGSGITVSGTFSAARIKNRMNTHIQHYESQQTPILVFICEGPASTADLDSQYLRTIAIQEKQYAEACQNMFKTTSKTATQSDETVARKQGSFWKSPLGGFRFSTCNFCSKRNGKTQ